MSKHRLWEHWCLCPLLHCNGARPRLISCLYVPILIKLKCLSESMQEEMLLQQLPPMADLAKIFLHRDFFPQWDLRPLKQFFKSMTACSFHHAVNINFLMKITVGSRRGERWVLQHLPIDCLDYSYNCSTIATLSSFLCLHLRFISSHWWVCILPETTWVQASLPT